MRVPIGITSRSGGNAQQEDVMNYESHFLRQLVGPIPEMIGLRHKILMR